MTVLEKARAGENTACVDCRATPYAGGLRCWDCFKARCDERVGPEHVCVRHPAGASCYQRGCRCRCADCREAKRSYARTHSGDDGVDVAA
jgi:hypothetical protein